MIFMDEYEKMLTKAYKSLPQVNVGGERFEMPRAETIIQGSQTTVRNFGQIAQAFRRDPKHLLKFLSKELAAPGSIAQQRATFQSKIPNSIMQQKLEAYVKSFVFCKECNRPDTQIVKEGRLSFLKCEACGAKSAIKSI